ncbi:MAG TPA: hypothetical protein VHQ90_26550 [Thermoanaerobaculia bacterium]|nr:hypothetical protein [Thermoanaerobaculia bacterium]
MPGSPQSNSPPWNESDSIRETTVHLFRHRRDRNALRRVGRLLYDLAIETGQVGRGPSITRAELRAVAADLRFAAGFLGMVRRTADESALDSPDEALARFAGKLAGKVTVLVEAIEGRLS